MMTYHKMIYHKKGFFILLLMIVLSLYIFLIDPAFAQDIIDLGLAGHWSNDYGDFYAIEVLDSNDISYNGEQGAYYAFCATSR